MRTKHTCNRLTIGIGLLLGLATVLQSLDADAVTTVRWCARWSSQFSDASNQSSGREDIDWNTAATQRDARYAKVVITHQGASTWVSYLTIANGGYYCTDSYTVTPGEGYGVTIWTQLKKDNRTITVMNDSESFTDPAVYGTFYSASYSIPADWTGLHYFNVTTPTLSKYTSMGVVAQRLLTNSTLFDYPDATTININLDSVDCPDGHQYLGHNGETYRVCAPNSTASIRKFVVSHEFGHAVVAMEGGRGLLQSDGSSYEADVEAPFAPPSATEPNCLPPAGGTNEHYLQTREYIGAASAEGFGHFIASAMYNYRGIGAWFHYYKTVHYDPPGTTDSGWGDYTNPWTDLDYETKWMFNNCWPGAGEYAGSLGTEWDWSEFFWELWAQGTANQQFEVSQMFDVWQNTAPETKCCTTESSCVAPLNTNPPTCNAGATLAEFGRRWPSLNTTLDLVTTLDATERERFRTLGDFKRVKYP